MIPGKFVIYEMVKDTYFSYIKKIYEANNLQAKYGKYSGYSKQISKVLTLKKASCSIHNLVLTPQF